MSGLWGKLYLVAGSLILVTYVYAESRGVVFGSADSKRAVPAEARGRGYRSHGFWYVGFHGGK